MSRDNNLVIYLNRFIYNEKRKLTYVFEILVFLSFSLIPPFYGFKYDFKGVCGLQTRIKTHKTENSILVKNFVGQNFSSVIKFRR